MLGGKAPRFQLFPQKTKGSVLSVKADARRAGLAVLPENPARTKARRRCKASVHPPGTFGELPPRPHLSNPAAQALPSQCHHCPSQHQAPRGSGAPGGRGPGRCWPLGPPSARHFRPRRSPGTEQDNRRRPTTRRAKGNWSWRRRGLVYGRGTQVHPTYSHNRLR